MIIVSAVFVVFQVVASGLLPPEHFVLLDRNGWATAPGARPEKLGDFEHLWSWSAKCAPAVTGSFSESVPCLRTKRRTVTVKDSRGHTVAGVRVIWGTRALIEQVPEDLLPNALTSENGTVELDVPTGEVVFSRVAGPGLMTDWQRDDLGSPRATLRGVDASEAKIFAVDERGKTLSHVHASLSSLDVKRNDELPLRVAAEKGTIRLSLPTSGASRLVIWSDERAPVEKLASNSSLSGRVILPPGCAIRGTIVGPDRKPISNAAIDVAFPLGTSAAWRRRVVTSNDGTFEARGITCGVSVFLAGKPSFAPVRRELVLKEETTDLGRVPLNLATGVKLLVTDAGTGNPINGAQIRVLNAPAYATTRADGSAVLEGVSEGEIEVELSADDYLPGTEHVIVGSKKSQVVRLTRGATFVATVLNARDHLPVGPGTLSVDLSGTTKMESFGVDGRVRVSGLRAGLLNVSVRLPGFATFKLPQRQVMPGATLDFGTVELRKGASITGKVIDDATSAPVQAHIRVPRPSKYGSRLSLVMNDWIEAQADESGQFQLAGLTGGDYRLLVEAQGYAPALTERITLEDSSTDNDAGPIRLSEALRLAVRCRPEARCGTQAQLFLGDANDDWANLTAAMANGKCEILRVPVGRHLLRIVDRGAIVAEKEVDLARNDSMQAIVDLALPDVQVSGVVFRGGRPADNGSVQFIGHTNDSAIPIMLDRKLDSVVVNSQVIGVVPRTLMVNVDGHGTFTTHDLPPGPYAVSYMGGNGTSPQQEVAVPDSASFTFRIDVPAAVVKGALLDEHGKIPEWARVELQSGTNVVSADMMPDGHFIVDGAPSGPLVVRAFNDTSEAQRSVAVEANGETEVNLTLREKAREEVRITALRSNGTPASGARLFLLCDGNMKVAEADAGGAASFGVSSSPSACLIAAFSAADGWAFDGPLSIRSDSGTPTELPVHFSSRAVTLSIQSTTASSISISSGTGFPLHRAFPFIGWPSMVSPSTPLRLRGVPPGTYVVGIRTGTLRSVSIDGNKDVLIGFQE
ncbi:MAG TPA: carboxypeptidase-like regulatory domain-containing protein [Thermoanaerobaculia bacterium]|jgi:hypothetical protein|nr:carboxypeptidase-like regulatory domain-containing protein [Thermoanaerobaculia bacterium]